MKYRKSLIILICIISIICIGIVAAIIYLKHNETNNINTGILSNQNISNKKTITGDFDINSYSSINDKLTYGSYLDKDGELILLSVTASDYNLPSYLYDYNENIRFRLTYSEDDYTVYDCKVINASSGEVMTDISEENLNKLFNIEYGKNIVENELKDTVKLSELKENVIYKYTAKEKTKTPNIENDIGKNCIIYTKDSDDIDYDEKISMCNVISSNAISLSINQLNEGDVFYVTYKILENDELLHKIEQDDIIYLSDYNNGDELSYKFQKYIYNDTSNDIKINLTNTSFDIVDSKSVIIKAGEICGFDWMIDSASIEY